VTCADEVIGKGRAASLTRDGLQRTDILAVNTDSRRVVEIQVKAAVPVRTPSWMLGTRGLVPAESDHEWYVFVALTPTINHAPTCFVVPRDHVAAATWIAHQDWLTDRTVEAGRRNAPVAQARVSVRTWKRYESRWDLLEQPTDEVLILLPTEMRQLAQEDRLGLPKDHPWNVALPAW
jgi:hypothetical protein